MPIQDPNSDLYAIVATYFVDHYYNTIYSVAKNASVNHSISLTDSYIQLMTQFINSIRNDKDVCHQVVLNLSEYYENVSGRQATHRDFEEKLLGAFIPPTFLAIMTEPQRDCNTAAIVSEIARNIGLRIIKTNAVSGIIDNRGNTHCIQRLQEYGQTNMRFLREDMHSKYMAESLGGSDSRAVKGDKMYQLYEKMAVEKREIEEKYNALVGKLAESMRLIHSLTAQRNAALEAAANSTRSDKMDRVYSPPIVPTITRPTQPQPLRPSPIPAPAELVYSPPTPVYSPVIPAVHRLSPPPTNPLIPDPTLADWENEFKFEED